MVVMLFNETWTMKSQAGIPHKRTGMLGLPNSANYRHHVFNPQKSTGKPGYFLTCWAVLRASPHGILSNKGAQNKKARFVLHCVMDQFGIYTRQSPTNYVGLLRVQAKFLRG
ncbi:hypothetical protein J3458_021848 [Metarhizium acridum]|uniref:uncharacterized protein n=1 Tax=Metarhizium acridum TaxID=92637 RepID=UPI001C6BA7A7|nr:hypothetical protein J3458_021848 [Metarhizium acridum]